MYKFKAKVWLYPGEAAWHFVTLPGVQSAEIKDKYAGLTRGFGSLPVQVTLGNTIWKTSIFPDNKAKTYLLPIKSAVRKSESIKAGGQAKFSVEILA